MDLTIKEAMSLEFLKNPEITPSSLDFTIAANTAGTQTMSSSSFGVKYPFRDDITTDSLSKTPAAIAPDPYTGFNSASVEYNRNSLGNSDHYWYASGLLKNTQHGSLTTAYASNISFNCEDWSLAKMGSTDNHSFQFTNNGYPSFVTTISYTCKYESSTPCTFRSNSALPVIQISKPGVAQEWALPEIDYGTVPLSEVRFVPDQLVAPYVTLIAPTD